MEVETLEGTEDRRPQGASLRRGESAPENAESRVLEDGSGQCPRSSLLTPSRTAGLRGLTISCRRDPSAIECSISAGEKRADPLLLASDRGKLKTLIKGFLRNRQTLFQSSCKTALGNYLIVSYKMWHIPILSS